MMMMGQQQKGSVEPLSFPRNRKLLPDFLCIFTLKSYFSRRLRDPSISFLVSWPKLLLALKVSLSLSLLYTPHILYLGSKLLPKKCVKIHGFTSTAAVQ
jgi:hypothetical protein